jgi:hypothetical protein
MILGEVMVTQCTDGELVSIELWLPAVAFAFSRLLFLVVIFAKKLLIWWSFLKQIFFMFRYGVYEFHGMWCVFDGKYSYCPVTLAARKGKRCCGAREALRLLWWRSEILPERKTFPRETTQRTIHLTTLQDATFHTGSTHADVSWYDCSPSSAKDGMTPLPRLEFRGTNSKPVRMLLTDKTTILPFPRSNWGGTRKHHSAFPFFALVFDLGLPH